MAQKFGAQYAWQSPRLNGNKRDMICGTWFQNGPKEAMKTKKTINPSFVKLKIENDSLKQ